MGNLLRRSRPRLRADLRNNDYIDDVRNAIQYAKDNGAQVVMLFAQTPEWARPTPNNGVWHPPEDVNDFANAVSYLYNQLASVQDNMGWSNCGDWLINRFGLLSLAGGLGIAGETFLSSFGLTIWKQRLS